MSEVNIPTLRKRNRTVITIYFDSKGILFFDLPVDFQMLLERVHFESNRQ